MKKLAIDCRMAQMSGIGVYIRNLVPRCMMRMENVEFFLLGYEGNFEISANARWQHVNFNYPIYSISEQVHFNAAIKACDAVWLPHYNVPLFCKKPMAVTVHDLAHLALKDLFSPLKRAYASIVFNSLRCNAAEIFMISQFTKHEFERLVGKPKGKCTVVHNGVDQIWRNSEASIGASTGTQIEGVAKKYFLAIGNIKPHKNIPLLCRAFVRMADKCEYNLVIVGERHGFRSKEVSVEKLMALSPGRIHFTGKVEDQELMQLMREAKALVFPSLYEGFGLPPLEAMLCGVPVIASNIPPVKEVCAEHALYFDAQDEEQLSLRLLEAIDMDIGERKRLIQAGCVHAQKFSWERTADVVVEGLYRLF